MRLVRPKPRRLRPRTAGKFATREELEVAVLAGREAGHRLKTIAYDTGVSLGTVWRIVNFPEDRQRPPAIHRRRSQP